MRVLHAPTNIANQAWLMAEGLRSLGHEVEVWQYGESRYGFPADRVIEHEGDPSAYFRTFVEAADRDFDVVHFHFAQSLIPARDYLPRFWDLPVWRSLGVKIVFTFHGTDVRLRSHHIADDRWSFYRYADIACDEDQIESNLSVIRRYAHQMTVGSVLDSIYVPEATYIPKSVDLATLVPKANRAGRLPIVLHAPSARSTKGTKFVLDGLDEVKARGFDFDIDLVEGVTHSELMDRVARADIVVEKLLGGDAGVGSLEAMAFGKVAIARIRDEVLAVHPDLPVVNADPETFADVLGSLLGDQQRRKSIGKAGRAYVEREHAPRVTARRLEDLYNAPGRTGVPSYPDWTTPESQRRTDSWIARMEKAESAQAATKELLTQARGRCEVLTKRLEALQTEHAAVRPTDG
ncbi:MAG TPA: glycosyltransferase family 4 protein [Acidimicrobiia bacterium]